MNFSWSFGEIGSLIKEYRQSEAVADTLKEPGLLSMALISPVSLETPMKEEWDT